MACRVKDLVLAEGAVCLTDRTHQTGLIATRNLALSGILNGRKWRIEIEAVLSDRTAFKASTKSINAPGAFEQVPVYGLLF